MAEERKFGFDEKVVAQAAWRNASLIEARERLRIDLEPRFLVQMAHLTTPATNWKLIESAVLRSSANLVMLDLEDSIPRGDDVLLRKAREQVIRAMVELDWGAKLKFFRPRGMSLDPGFEDITVIVEAAGRHIDGLIYPKIDGPEEVSSLDETLGQIERARGLQEGSIRIGLLIESVSAEQRVLEIAGSSRRLVCLIFGAFDYWASLGMINAQYRPDHPLISGARLGIVKAAASVGVPAIAEMTLNYPTADKSEDERRAAIDECRRDAALALEYGFTGKWTGIPAQVTVAQEVFSIDDYTIDRALRHAREYARAEAGGLGAVMIDGQMADRATDRINRTILKTAYALGRLDVGQARELGIVG